MDSSPLSPDALLSQVMSEKDSYLEKNIAVNSQTLRYTVARRIIALMRQHKELVIRWHVGGVWETVTLMGKVEWLVSELVGVKTSFSSYQYWAPLSPNSIKKVPDITLFYSGREWRLSPDNFYLSLAVLAKRMDIIEELVTSNDK
jgi:hypothetical protein